MVIFANGFCKQHGGATPPEYAKALADREQELFARRKARAIRNAERFNRRHGWAGASKNFLPGASSAISQMEPAKASTAEEQIAAVETFTR